MEGEGVDYGTVKEKGISFSWQMSTMWREEFLEHLLIHCPAGWRLWAALLYTLGWQGVSLVRNLIIGWKAFPMRERDKNSGWQHPYVYSGTLEGKKQNCF